MFFLFKTVCYSFNVIILLIICLYGTDSPRNSILAAGNQDGDGYKAQNQLGLVSLKYTLTSKTATVGFKKYKSKYLIHKKTCMHNMFLSFIITFNLSRLFFEYFKM